MSVACNAGCNVDATEVQRELLARFLFEGKSQDQAPRRKGDTGMTRRPVADARSPGGSRR
jgi:hypothetical protein